MDVVGANIRKIRRARGLLQKELADRARMDPSNLSKLERGDYTWTKENLERIADSLGIGVPELFLEGDRSVPVLGYISAGSPGSATPGDSQPVLRTMNAKLDLILGLLQQP